MVDILELLNGKRIKHDSDAYACNLTHKKIKKDK